METILFLAAIVGLLALLVILDLLHNVSNYWEARAKHEEANAQHRILLNETNFPDSK